MPLSPVRNLLIVAVVASIVAGVVLWGILRAVSRPEGGIHGEGEADVVLDVEPPAEVIIHEPAPPASAEPLPAPAAAPLPPPGAVEPTPADAPEMVLIPPTDTDASPGAPADAPATPGEPPSAPVTAPGDSAAAPVTPPAETPDAPVAVIPLTPLDDRAPRTVLVTMTFAGAPGRPGLLAVSLAPASGYKWNAAAPAPSVDLRAPSWLRLDAPLAAAAPSDSAATAPRLFTASAVILPDSTGAGALSLRAYPCRLDGSECLMVTQEYTFTRALKRIPLSLGGGQGEGVPTGRDAAPSGVGRVERGQP